jgi:hypothetical protein
VDGVHELARLFREHEQMDNQRHEENLERFGLVSGVAQRLTGEMRLVIALLIANGVINVVGVFHP